MKSFFNGIADSVTSAVTSMKFGKSLASEFQNLPGHFYELSALQLTGQNTPVVMSEFKGKVVLVVNIASLCGYTAGNNKFLSSLAQKYSGRSDFVILAFPCSQFGGQEYSETKKICDSHMDGLKDCKECLGKNLILMEKVDVNGDTAHPVFKYLRLNSSLFDEKNGKVSSIPWNYCKFLIDGEGSVKQFFKSGDYKEVEAALSQLLPS